MDIITLLTVYQPILKIALAVLAFLLFWALKGKLTGLLGKILYRLVNMKKQLITEEKLKDALIPCNTIFALFGAYIALAILGWAGNVLVVHCLRIAAISLCGWILVRFWDACSDLVFGANDKMGEELHLNMSKTLINFLTKAVKVCIVALTVLAVIAETGTDVTALITGLGLGGLTFALAAQDTASNLFSGLMILLDKPFVVDDYIETPDVVGTVEDITFRSTRIRTVTNAQIVVPNSTLTGKPVTNWSRLQKRRVSFTIGLEYGTSSQQMTNCVSRIEELLNNCDGIVEGSPCVNFDAFGTSSLNINIVYYTKETALAAHLKVKEALNLQIMSIIEEEGCSFAFPTQTLHIAKEE